MESLMRVSEELIKTQKGHPHVVCKTKDILGSETYRCRQTGGEIILEAESPLAAVYGINHLSVGIAGGHSAECMGEWKPRFALRPLWVKTVPSDSQAFCQRILELGYNSVLFDDDKINPPLLEALRNYGLKSILKPQLPKNFSGCPLDKKYAGQLQLFLKEFLKKYPKIDFLFWESLCWEPNCQDHPAAIEATQADLVKAEIALIEESLGAVSLIYYIPAINQVTAQQQTPWLLQLGNEITKTTIIAFPAVAGSLHDDHMPAHPLWQTLRKTQHAITTPLMPIINIGSINQGEGLWPSIPLDLIDKYLAQCHRHNFVGAIGLVNSLPSPRAFLSCALWTASQAMWKDRPASQLAHTWFLSHRPDIDYLQLSDPFAEVRNCVTQLSYLRSLPHEEKQRNAEFQEKCRAIAENISARLKWLQLRFGQAKAKNRPSCSDYFTHFAVDARRIIANTLNACNVSIIHLRKEEETQEGFWTNKDQRHMLQIPQRGEGVMASIYDEARSN